jgi:hypothetical protein
MSSNADRSKRRENLTKLSLIFLFLGGLVAFIAYMTFWGPGLAAFKLGWIDLVLLTFATYRLGHLVAYDLVMEPFRKLFTKTLPDPTGAGETVEPKGEGFQQAIGQLICCPICSGTWVAALLVYGLYLFPDPMRVFLTMTAAIGGAEILNSAGEALSWTGQHQRTLSGAQMSARKKNIVRIEQPCEDNLPERDEVRSLSERIKRIRKKD